MSDKPILIDVTTRPNAAKYELYRWCDYAELRCLTHKDKRFSRDGLAEALGEAADAADDVGDDVIDPGSFSVPEDFGEESQTDRDVEAGSQSAEIDDAQELLSTRVFMQLAWRANAFGAAWPFEVDRHVRELRLKADRDDGHVLYLQLLLSSLLRYCPSERRHELTGPFELVALQVFAGLMPAGAKVHRFGAGNGVKFVGNLYEKLEKLAKEIRGKMILTRRDFPKNDVGDGGLDLVAWHDLADWRGNIPVAFAQCGCTVTGWPEKALQASPAMLGNTLKTGHPWATYYFMPLDLAEEVDGQMEWQQRRDVVEAIFIDRLRFVRLAKVERLRADGALADAVVAEATAMELT